MTLKMTTAQVVETSVTVTNSSFQNYTHPDDHTTRNTDTPGFKPFTIVYFIQKLNNRPNFGSRIHVVGCGLEPANYHQSNGRVYSDHIAYIIAGSGSGVPTTKQTGAPTPPGPFTTPGGTPSTSPTVHSISPATGGDP